MMLQVLRTVMIFVVLYGTNEHYQQLRKGYTEQQLRARQDKYVKAFLRSLTIIPPIEIDCEINKTCVPYQFCGHNKTSLARKYRIDYSDTHIDCGYMWQCCDNTNVLPINTDTVIPPIAPLRYQQCSYSDDYKLYRSANLTNNSTHLDALSLPWIVSIVIRSHVTDKTDTLLCGGSIISPNVVLTTATCYNVTANYYGIILVRAGEFGGSSLHDVEIQERKVKEKIIYEGLEFSMTATDVALLWLECSFELNDNVQPVCLPPPYIVEEEYDKCFIAGYAHYKSGATNYDLNKRQMFTLQILSDKHCDIPSTTLKNATYDKDNHLVDSLLCIDKPSSSSTKNQRCYADAGMPIVCGLANTLTYYQVGIARQHKLQHCNGYPNSGIALRVQYFQRWIEHIFCERSEDRLLYEGIE